NTKEDEPPPPVPITINTTPADPPSPEPTVTVVPTNSGSTATLGPPGVPTGPPVPASPTGASPARPKSEPRVQSYLEEEYRWQPGDSFAAVSRKFYFSAKYDAAVQQYKRDYPL